MATTSPGRARLRATDDVAMTPADAWAFVIMVMMLATGAVIGSAVAEVIAHRRRR